MGNSCRPGCFGQRRSVTPISWLTIDRIKNILDFYALFLQNTLQKRGQVGRHEMNMWRLDGSLFVRFAKRIEDLWQD
jgi:hypothetical protein